MKLICQSDDYGITRAVSEGTLFAIKCGFIRSTGLFSNMPNSQWAANKIKKVPEVSVGIDINLVTGNPISFPKDIPGLVDNQGVFIPSRERMALGKISSFEHGKVIFKTDPYNYDEVLIETRAQVERFIEMMGRKPAYIHNHSFSTINSQRAAEVIADEYDIPLTAKLMTDLRITVLKSQWLDGNMDLSSQFNLEIEERFIEQLRSQLDKELVYYLSHCGFVDDPLMKLSSFTLIRAKDTACAVSDKVKNFLNENGIELINHNKLYELIGK